MISFFYASKRIIPFSSINKIDEGSDGSAMVYLTDGSQLGLSPSQLNNLKVALSAGDMLAILD